MRHDDLGDGIELWTGDCRDVAEELEPGSVDLLLTDPPYGMAWSPDTVSQTVRAVNGDGCRAGESHPPAFVLLAGRYG